MTAAEVLGKHRAVEYVGDGVWWCNCGTVHNADHVLDALKVAGYAVVELPEESGGGWLVNDDDDFRVSTNVVLLDPSGTRHPGCKVVWGSMELNLCLSDARNLAVALLAAAAEVS